MYIQGNVNITTVTRNESWRRLRITGIFIAFLSNWRSIGSHDSHLLSSRRGSRRVNNADRGNGVPGNARYSGCFNSIPIDTVRNIKERERERGMRTFYLCRCIFAAESLEFKSRPCPHYFTNLRDTFRAVRDETEISMHQ